MVENEVWKEIEGYSKYEVSTLGNVRDKATQELKPLVWNGNFLCTNLTADVGGRSLCKVHRLVGIAFIPNPDNAYNVVHRSEDRSDNSVDNLYWKSKQVKEKKERKTTKHLWLGKEYTAEELSSILNLDVVFVKNKFSLGWKVNEIIAGSKDFSGSGYQTDTHWYPTKSQYEREVTVKRAQEVEAKRKEKLKENALKRAERKAKIHHGFGIFVNSPIKGIVDRKATRAYYVWQGIISRCYNPNHVNYSNYGGRGCTVNEKWKHFQDFAIWYQEQQERGIGNAHVNWHVDKDILLEGNLEYGPDTCCLVPDDVNIFFASITGSYRGSTQYKGKWTAGISILGVKQQRCFDTEEEAREWYLKGKTQAARVLLWKYEGLLEDRVVEKLSQI